MWGNKRLLQGMAYAALFMFATGCGTPKPEDNASVGSQFMDNMSMDDMFAENLKEQAAEKKLYFAATKGKIFYSNTSGGFGNTGFHTSFLLKELLHENKKNLPRISRKKRLNIALEVDSYSKFHEALTSSGQSFILSNRRYALSNTDASTLKVIKKVLAREDDTIYQKSSAEIATKAASNVIIYLTASQFDDDVTIEGKLLSKNGTLLGIKKRKFSLQSDDTKIWVEARVPRNSGMDDVYEIMKSPVTAQAYSGINTKSSATNITQKAAETFCHEKHGARLVTPYIFEHARRSMVMAKPVLPANSEILAPYDEDDDEIYFQEGDQIATDDSDIITFVWNSESYFATSNIYKSHETTFRCMRVKR